MPEQPSFVHQQWALGFQALELHSKLLAGARMDDHEGITERATAQFLAQVIAAPKQNMGRYWWSCDGLAHACSA